ncbi:helix-turn-helix domain-containing protein [Listeria booriae]|uniref:helix-turn-helix domain-containing protein n=1 Tax=Listeria booriae TaxID=1552123 RepID=UPI001628C878|nr:Crp/Fnr family transcriptional regulator [Listeria booriae]MBC1227040.1 Crp/Fnr family transcriptional regulator [Listeria booriae]
MYHDWPEMTFSEKQEIEFHCTNHFFIIRKGIIAMESKAGTVIDYLTVGDLIVTNLLDANIIFYAKTEVRLEKRELSVASIDSCTNMYNRLMLERLDEYKCAAPARLGLCLKRLATKFGTQTEKGTQIVPAFTQYDLANYCNLKREYVSLLLRNLVDAGVIRVRPKPWLVLNMDKLDDYILKNGF